MQQIQEDISSSNIESNPQDLDPNDIILERQSLQLGCDEMQRITDDIIVPVFVKAAKSIKRAGVEVDVVLMDCESPVDAELYNVGVRCDFSIANSPLQFSIIADPSEFDFTFTATDQNGEETTKIFAYHEVTPPVLEQLIADFFEKHASQIDFQANIDEIDQRVRQFKPPFRVQYDEEGNVSDVASTQTISEAIKMGSTFAHMFKREDSITIIDQNGEILC